MMKYAIENWLACPNRVMEIFPGETDFPMSQINKDLISRDNQFPPLLAKILKKVRKLKHSKPSHSKKPQQSTSVLHSSSFPNASICIDQFANQSMPNTHHGTDAQIPVYGELNNSDYGLIPNEEPQQFNSLSQSSSFPNACISIDPFANQSMPNTQHENNAQILVYCEPNNSDYGLIPIEEPQQSNSLLHSSSFPNACNSIAQSSDQLMSNAYNENYAPVQVYGEPNNSECGLIPSEEPQQST
ncbi:hypothetical protein QR98_0090690, partial [Sarcoptes scabiei]